MKVSDLINPETSAWNKELILNTFVPIDSETILNIPLGEVLHEVSRVWHYSSCGNFTVKSAYHLTMDCRKDGIGCSSSRNEGLFWKKLWSLNLPPRVRMFGWRVCVNGLATKSNLNKRLNYLDSKCDLCGALDENDIHVLLECPMAEEIWYECGLDEKLFEGNNMNIREWVGWLFDNFDDDLCASVLAVCWAIWNNRNKASFAQLDTRWKTAGFRALQWVAEYKEAVAAVHAIPQTTGVRQGGSPHLLAAGSSTQTQRRSREMQLLSMGIKNHVGWGGPEVEEARAFYFGLKKAWECGYRKIIAESDCLSIISKIKNKEYIVQYFDFISFAHVRRGGNTLAHSIASSTFNSCSEFIWLEDFPDFAIDIANQTYT
ncbi:hypothetical protein RDABS01_025300 [Bienertia sinuspersici]